MPYVLEEKGADHGLHYWEEEQRSIVSQSGVVPSSPTCSGTTMEWYIKSYTVGSRKDGKSKVILRDIGRYAASARIVMPLVVYDRIMKWQAILAL